MRYGIQTAAPNIYFPLSMNCTIDSRREDKKAPSPVKELALLNFVAWITSCRPLTSGKYSVSYNEKNLII